MEAHTPYCRYDQALELIDEGKYNEAYSQLKALGDYKDCKKLLKNFDVVYGKSETITYDENGGIELKTVTEYEYDERGNVVLKDLYDKDMLIIKNKEENQYNEYGDPILWVSYDENGNIENKAENKAEYDENGNLISWTSYDENGNTIRKTEYEYRDSATIEVSYEADGSIECKYEYDEDGNENLLISYKKGGHRISQYEYEYNENQICENRYYENGEFVYKYEYEHKYDEFGNVTVEVGYNSEGNMIQKVTWSDPIFLYHPDGKK